MEKIYHPSNIEQSLYKLWEQRGYFKPNRNKKESFCIMIPPPNITGSLHMGHAFQQTIMDIIIRYQRMQNKNTLWQVGTDHAGIATQMVVERSISIEEGKTRYDYGRDAFIKKIWKWKEKSGNVITQQMRRLGISVDWERERFTMDVGFSNAVKEVFIRLYNEGLIYRGKRLVNWDPQLHTAISDLEVEHRSLNGSIWYIRYPLADGEKTADGKNYLVVATTRPETILGDTGIIVNPKDSRYKNLIGKFAVLKLVDRRIPIVGDEYADMKKGTGCVKITPAHDFNDYKVGRRHKFPMINIFTFKGNIRESAEVFDYNGNKSNFYSTKIPVEFQALDRFSARHAIISSLDDFGLLEKVKQYNLTLPYGDRSGVIIEPMLTDQWYIRVDILKKPAMEAVKNGDICFVPEKYKNMYFSWMKNTQDWCISRQLWWGHDIPAWYDECGNVYVGRSQEEVRKENNLSTNTVLRKDDDVLDTWFSSSLWTFSALGWPDNTDFLRQFHPTTVVVSAFDIIFFWIARMIMMTMHFIKDVSGKPQIPFKIVYITGLVCDDEGKKMSKSKGNIIDPLDIIDGISLEALLKKRTDNMMQPKLANKIRKCTKRQFPNGIKPYGTDALRLTLTALASTSRNINWNMNYLEGYRNFCNKLWNVSRFVLMHTENKDCGFNNTKKVFSLADRWILNTFNQTIKMYRESLDNFRFDIAVNILYEFTWNQFCDWYLELIKPIMNKGSQEEILSIRYTLITVLEALLRLAHPIIPFITEIIWQRVKIVKNIKSDTIMLQSFPEFSADFIDQAAAFDVKWLKQVVVAVRNIRAEINISPKKPLQLLFRCYSKESIRRVNENKNFLRNVAYLEHVAVLSNNDNPASIIKVIDDAELLIPITGLIDKNLELNRLEKEIKKVETEISRIRDKLKNEKFIVYAPKMIIAKLQKKNSEYIRIKEKLIKQKEIITTP